MKKKQTELLADSGAEHAASRISGVFDSATLIMSRSFQAGTKDEKMRESISHAQSLFMEYYIPEKTLGPEHPYTLMALGNVM